MTIAGFLVGMVIVFILCARDLRDDWEEIDDE